MMCDLFVDCRWFNCLIALLTTAAVVVVWLIVARKGRK